MKKYIYLFLASAFLISFSSCEESSVKALDTSFASFTSTTMDIGVDADSETSKEIEIYTTNTTSSDRSIPVMIVEEGTDANAINYTVPSTVIIPGGSNVGILKVDVKDVDLELNDKFLTIRLQSTETTNTGKALKLSLSENCPGTVKLKVNVSFDSYPEEAAWRIKDADGYTVMASADPFAYGGHAGATAPLTIPECLPSGTYTIQIYDGWGDGGTTYNITANGIQVFYLDGDDYENYDEGTFSI